VVFRLNRLEGKDGKATIKGLGSLVGEVSDWKLTRRGDDDSPSDGLFDLRAVFSFLVPSLLVDPDYNEDRELFLTVAKGRTIKLRLNEPERLTLRGKVLFMEGVAIEWSRP
jgi:hypothetical protein